MTDSRFSVRGSVGQVSVTGPSGTAVELTGADGAGVATGVIDSFGDCLTLGDLGVTDGLKGLGALRRQPSRRWRPAGLEVPPEPERRVPLATQVRGAPPVRFAGRVKRALARQWVLAMRRVGLPPRVGLAAVVGLLAAGVGLALVRLLRHKN